MPITVGSPTQATQVAEVDAKSALRISSRPLDHGSLGHYRVTHRALLANTKAANARIFELRNTGTNFIVPTRLIVTLYQTAAGTAQMAGLDFFKCTSFSAVDTTNTVTPTASQKKTTGMTASPGGAAVRGVTVAGAAAGMTGGTLTKDGGAFAAITYAVAAAAGTSTAAQWGPYDILPKIGADGTHPFVFAQNEGLEIENRTLNTTSFGVEITVDLSWAEVATTVI